MAFTWDQFLGSTSPDEEEFQRWYASHASRLNLSPDPDDPLHYYDWRAAFRAGAEPDADAHWPSEFKREGHPNLVVDGMDTRTMTPADKPGRLTWEDFLGGSQPPHSDAWKQHAIPQEAIPEDLSPNTSLAGDLLKTWIGSSAEVADALIGGSRLAYRALTPPSTLAVNRRLFEDRPEEQQDQNLLERAAGRAEAGFEGMAHTGREAQSRVHQRGPIYALATTAAELVGPEEFVPHVGLVPNLVQAGLRPASRLINARAGAKVADALGEAAGAARAADEAARLTEGPLKAAEKADKAVINQVLAEEFARRNPASPVAGGKPAPGFTRNVAEPIRGNQMEVAFAASALKDEDSLKAIDQLMTDRVVEQARAKVRTARAMMDEKALEYDALRKAIDPATSPARAQLFDARQKYVAAKTAAAQAHWELTEVQEISRMPSSWAKRVLASRSNLQDAMQEHQKLMREARQAPDPRAYQIKLEDSKQRVLLAQDMFKRAQSGEYVTRAGVIPGETAKPPAKFGKLGEFMRSNFTSTGHMPKWMFERIASVDGFVRAAANDGRALEKQLTQQVAEHVKKNGASEQDLLLEVKWRMHQDPRAGSRLAELPADLSDTAALMRENITNLSKQIMGSDMVSPEMKQVILGNEDHYLHRSYRAFDDPKWVSVAKADPQWSDWVKRFNGEMFPELDAKKAEGMLEGFISRHDGPIWQNASLSDDAKGVLKRRKDMPSYLREALGEYDDVRTQFLRTVQALTKRVETHKMAQAVRERGIRAGALSASPRGAIDSASPQTVRIFENEPGVDPTYASKIIAREIERLGSIDSVDSNWWRTMNAAAKAGKTILSAPSSHARNFYSSGLLYSAAGRSVSGALTRGRELARMTRDGLLKIPAGGSEAFESFQVMHRLGVVGDATRAREFEYWMKNAPDLNLKSDFGQAAKKRLSNVADLASKWYQAGDDFWKAAAWFDEVDNYGGIYKARGIEITDEIREQIHNTAAQIVRDTMPTYSRAPYVVHALKKNPVLSSFPTFPAEVTRNVIETAKLAAREMSSPETFELGAKRAGRLLTAMAVPSMAALGTGAALLSRKSPEEVLADRRAASTFQPDWAKYSETPIVWKWDGGFAYVDTSYLSPYSALVNPVLALLIGGDDRELAAVEQALDPYTSFEVGSTAVAEGLFATRFREGVPQAIREGSAGEIQDDRLQHTVERGFEPSGIRQAREGISALRRGDTRRAVIEALSLGTGVRITAIEITDSARYFRAAFVKETQAASRKFRKVMEDPSATPARRYQALEALREEEARLGKELNQFVTDARYWNTDMRKLADVLGQGISKENLRRAAQGLPLDLNTIDKPKFF